MRAISLAIVLVAAAWGAGTGVATAQVAALALHAACDARTPESDRMMLPQWYRNAAPGSPDPACVVRRPALQGLTLQSVRVDDAPYGTGVVVVVEFADSARGSLMQATLDHVGRKMAIVVGGRIVAMPTIASAMNAPRLSLRAPSVDEAERITRAIGWTQPAATRQRDAVVAADPRAAGNDAWQPLHGSWTVSAASTGSSTIAAAEFLGRSWRIDGRVLTVTGPDGRNAARYMLADLDLRARPGSFVATPNSGPEKRQWFVFAREGERLKVGSLEDGRATGFDPNPRLHVLTLLPDARATQVRQAMSARTCSIMKEAAAAEGLASLVQYRHDAPATGGGCDFDGSGGRVAARVLQAPGAVALDAERQALQRRKYARFVDEPELGRGAFSAVQGAGRVYVAARGDRVMMLALPTTGVAEAELHRFARRVLERL